MVNRLKVKKAKEWKATTTDQDIPNIMPVDETDYTLQDEKQRHVAVLGSTHLVSYIVLHMMRLQNIAIHVIDRKDPHQIFLNTQMVRYLGDPRLFFHHWSERDFQLNYLQLAKEYKIDTIVNGLYIQDEKYSMHNPIETMTTNAVFTSILMDCLRKSDFEGTFLHIGTAKVYGVRSNQTVDIKPTTENKTPEPVGMKAVSRYVQENIITGMAKTYSIGYIVFRLGTLYGIFTPRDMVLNQWIKDMLLQNSLKVHGKGHESRDFTHVYDVAELITRFVNKNKYHGITNEIYNIGSCNKQEARLGNVADAILGFLKPHSPDSTIIKTDYVDEADRDYREFLDCTKAEKHLKYYPFVGFDAIKLLIGNVPYIAKYELGFGEKEMLEINTLCNRFDHQNRIKVAKQAGLNLNTKEGQEYIERQVEAITSRSEESRVTSAQEVLADPKSEVGQKLRKFMQDNNLNINDVGQVMS